MSPLPAAEPQIPAKQIIYPNVVFNVSRAEDGSVQLAVLAPGEMLVFPMPAEYADALGHKLSATRLAIPTGVKPSNGNGKV